MFMKMKTGWEEFKMKNRMAKCFVLAMAFWMSLSAAAMAAISPFSDVPMDHWAEDAIMRLHRDGYLHVGDDRRFDGEASVTYYDMAYMLGRLVSKMGGATSGTVPFGDVPQNHWAYQRVGIVAEEGIMEGFSDGTFRGDKAITRGEIAILLDKMLSRKGLSDYSEMSFGDVPKSHKAYKAVCSVCHKGIMESHPLNGNFYVDKYITRYEVVKLYPKLIELVIK